MKTIKIAIAGLGTVGQETIRQLEACKDSLRQKYDMNIQIVGVSARDRNKNRGIDLSLYTWFNSPLDMMQAGSPDIMVELIGGSEGTAHDIALTAISKGIHLVTANKALLAVYGNELARTAEDANVTIAYEAAIAAAIPIVKEIRSARQQQIDITMIQGILNGTCNFILDKMAKENISFDSALCQAQQLGYAEQDPAFDIDGVDSAHKLTLLSSLAFGIKVNLDAVKTEGIRDISAEQVQAAQKANKHIKLIAHAEKNGDTISRFVHQAQLADKDSLAHVDGTENAVMYRIGKDKLKMLKGQGAGGAPTAESVVADIVDLAKGNRYPLFSVPYRELQSK